jgi:phosphatidylserine/phosphatidylglycerophosphate/cardiolipin synthase-like enzyme
MVTNEFTLFNRAEYFIQLVALANRTKRGNRIAVATMAFDTNEPLVASVMQALCKAATRGVMVYLAVDAHSFMVQNKSLVFGPLWFHTALPEQLVEPYTSWFGALEALRKSGGHYAITNTPHKRFSTPFAGRSHIKTAIINDHIFIGGCNLDNAAHVDIMTGWHSKKAADWTYKWITQLVTTSSTQQTFSGKDQKLILSPELQLLIDAGVPNQSIIYDHAMQLIDEAREYIFFTCQFFPGGRTGQHLLQAHKRGVDVRIVYSSPLAHRHLALGHWLYNTREFARLPHIFFAEQRLANAPLIHAKVIATDKGAIIGSHNYITQGVRLGTAEIALLKQGPAFAQYLIRKIAQNL